MHRQEFRVHKDVVLLILPPPFPRANTMNWSLMHCSVHTQRSMCMITSSVFCFLKTTYWDVLEINPNSIKSTLLDLFDELILFHYVDKPQLIWLSNFQVCYYNVDGWLSYIIQHMCTVYAWFITGGRIAESKGRSICNFDIVK